MKNVISAVVGVVVGAIGTAVIGWNMMAGMMLHETASPYNMEETVDKIQKNALAKGWVVPSMKQLHKSIKKNGGGDVPPITLINLCQGNHAYRMMKNDKNKKLSVFMPCTVSVYEKSDGKIYIGTMNAGLMGAMFGGVVAEVMAEVSTDQESFIKFAK
ncbi:MAG: DUF302 domain-containing protein [Gammaproteobacteria bacterium]|nr:MAG: DUF302 domain-containing protein [Gammaproteobacteria bacterium]